MGGRQIHLRPRMIGWSWSVPGVTSGWALLRCVAEFDAMSAALEGH